RKGDEARHGHDRRRPDDALPQGAERELPVGRRLGRRARPRPPPEARLRRDGRSDEQAGSPYSVDDDPLRFRHRCQRPAAARGRGRRLQSGGQVKVAVKIWRANAETGDRALREYEVDAPEWVTLLDVLDIIKDRHDGTLAFRKSCRMMICGSCGMRMDGAAVLACKTRMYDIAQSGHVPVVSAMGNLPILKALVVDMEPFWNKFKPVNPHLQPGYE